MQEEAPQIENMQYHRDPEEACREKESVNALESDDSVMRPACLLLLLLIALIVLIIACLPFQEISNNGVESAANVVMEKRKENFSDLDTSAY